MRRKLYRYAENAKHPRVLEPDKALFSQVKGQWNGKVFEKPQPITLELACGRGEYTVGLAKTQPGHNFVGVDIKGDRLWQGMSQADELGLDNVAFLRTHIDKLDKLFAPAEVAEAWLVFPDPRPRRRDEKRRLTSPRYLDLYRQIMGGQGSIHLKTDSNILFTYTLEQLMQRRDAKLLYMTWDLARSPLLELHQGIVTRYERMFLQKGMSIKFLSFCWQ